MRALGLGYPEIAAEIGRRYRVRPREAYRLAYGWTLDHAAARFNARAGHEAAGPQRRASLAGGHLCEYEKWPSSQHRPSLYVLTTLACMYKTEVLALLDLAGHENLPHDRLALLHSAQSARPAAATLKPAGAVGDSTQPGTATPGPMAVPWPADVQGISLSLPYVPGRLVAEVSEPAASSRRHAATPGGTYPPARSLRVVNNANAAQ